MHVSPRQRGFGRAPGATALGVFLMLVTAPATGAAPGRQAGGAMQATRVAVGDEAIDFTLESIDGESFRLSDLRGEKNAVVIFFRGTW